MSNRQRVFVGTIMPLIFLVASFALIVAVQNWFELPLNVAWTLFIIPVVFYSLMSEDWSYYLALMIPLTAAMTYGVITLGGEPYQPSTASLIATMVTVIMASAIAKMYGDSAARILLNAKQELLKDPLTGVYNIRYLPRLEDAIKDNEVSSTMVAVFDVDNFKNLNDEYGHSFGDRVLQNVIRIVKEEVGIIEHATGSYGRVIRIGGDEFAVVLPNANEDNAGHFVSYIETRIAQLPLRNYRELVTVRVTGGAYHTAGLMPLKDMIHNADRNMQFNKKRKGSFIKGKVHE